MSPLELMNDSPCHIKATVASTDPASSGPGNSDASRPKQACFTRSVSHVRPVGQPILPSLSPADPGSSQLIFDNSSWPGYVEVVPKGETVDDSLSDFRLPPYDQAFDQYLDLAPPGRKKLQGSGIVMAAASADRGVKRKNQFGEDNAPKCVLSNKPRVSRNARERRRVATIAHEYEQLRSLVPEYYLPRPRNKLSRFQILTSAIRYIKELTNQLRQRDVADSFGSTISYFQDPTGYQTNGSCCGSGSHLPDDVNQSCQQYSPGFFGDWRYGRFSPLDQTPSVHPGT